MTPEQYQRVGQLYHQALELDRDQRLVFLDRECAGDAVLRREVESLIASHEEEETFLAAPAVEVVAKQMAEKGVLSISQQIGHYRVLSLLGKGGMGEVYLAQDTKLSRKVALKALPAQFTQDPERVRRFEREARAASALNHPNILAIYEIGQEGDKHYIVTEFVDGETLRQRCEQTKVSLLEALDITIQIASALAAAHEAGVVHRDIKPDNVMLRRDGYVKVLDFGLAKLVDKIPEAEDLSQAETAKLADTTTPGVVMGTVAYMSPEQARGLKVDARTDIWSLGVLLYEIVAGHRPFSGSTTSDVIAAILEKEPTPLSNYAPNLPAELERIVAKALRKEREERYQSVKDLLIEFKDLQQELRFGVRPERTVSSTKLILDELKRHRVGVALTLAALVIAALALFFYFTRQPALTEKDTILLADFANNTGDVVFDDTLKQGLAVQLQQTPFLNLFPEEGVRETLRLMDRSPDERVTRAIGREICQRQGLKAMLIGTIASLGRNYVITLEAISGQTGAVIANRQVEAEGKEQVLRALGQAANELRQKLGESLSTLQKFNAPIEQATTSSLPALKALSAGIEQFYRGTFREAIPFFNQAVELDPNFAHAYGSLAWAYSDLGNGKKAAEFAEKAYALRERATERERLLITATYYYWVTGELDKEREVCVLAKRLYPNDWTPHDLLTQNYNLTGQAEKAVVEAREAIRLNPSVVHPYVMLATALQNLGRYDEAVQVIKQAQERKLEFSFPSQLYRIAFAQGDTAAMQQQLDLIVKKSGPALILQAQTAAFAGRWREAQAFYRRRTEVSGQRNVTEKAAPLPIQARVQEALFGFCQLTGEDAVQALTLSQINPFGFVFVPSLPDGSLCGKVSEAQKFADELAKQYPKATLVNGLALPRIRAAIALQRNQPAQAIESLKATIASAGESGFHIPYMRGQAYLRLGRGAEAAAEFQKILDHRGWGVLSLFYPLARLGLARAVALTGDTAKGREHYQNFFALWKDADPDLPILIEAKKEYAKLK